jgi:hypothetical protein
MNIVSWIRQLGTHDGTFYSLVPDLGGSLHAVHISKGKSKWCLAQGTLVLVLKILRNLNIHIISWLYAPLLDLKLRPTIKQGHHSRLLLSGP